MQSYIQQISLDLLCIAIRISVFISLMNSVDAALFHLDAELYLVHPGQRVSRRSISSKI